MRKYTNADFVSKSLRVKLVHITYDVKFYTKIYRFSLLVNNIVNVYYSAISLHSISHFRRHKKTAYYDLK